MNTQKNTLALATLSLLIITSIVFVSREIFSPSQEIVMDAIDHKAAVADFDNALIAKFSFEEGSGNTTTDSIGSRTGTLTNGPSWISGKVGSGALSFDGVDDFVDAGDITSAGGVGSLSVAVWVKPSSSSGSLSVVTKSRSGFTSWQIARSAQGRYYFATGNETGSFVYAASDSFFPDTDWHHVVGVYDGAHANVYVDGVAVIANPPALTGTMKSVPYPVCIGGTADGGGAKCISGMAGSVDDFRIYNRALTDQEISDLYVAGGGSLGPDVTSPTISLTPLVSTTDLKDSLTLEASASDNIGVAGVQFKVDGDDIGNEDTTTPYSVSWNTTTVPNGSHTLTAVARDDAGNTKTSAEIIVTVTNPLDVTNPTVSVTSSGGTKSGTITITADASDDRGVAGVQFKIDGNDLETEDVTAPYSVSLDTTLYSNASHSLTALARDGAGNTTESSAVTITILNTDTTPPTVSNPLPTGVISRNLTQATLQVTTNEYATCRYSTTANIPYASMVSGNTFSTVSGSLHTKSVPVSINTSYTYYVRCIDQSSNPTLSDTTITFRTPAATPANQVVIDSSSLIDVPTAALWARRVNFSPSDGETVKANPPAFSWLYRPNLELEVQPWLRDRKIYLFVFQAAYSEADLRASRNLAVNVLTRSNAYNFLDEFTPGSTVYWRIGYIVDTSIGENVPNGLDRNFVSTTSVATIAPFQSQAVWGAVRSFTIDDNAISWDRSMLADETYLASKSHPRIFFNNNNKAAFWTTTQQDPDWSRVKTYLDSQIINPSVWSHSYIGNITWDGGMLLAADAFMWQMTGDQKYLNNLSPKPQELLVTYAQAYISSGAFMEDMDTAGRGSQIYYVGLAYDWLYDVMTEEQRTLVRQAIETQQQFHLYAATFSAGPNSGCGYPLESTDDPKRNLYPLGRKTTEGCYMYGSESHQYHGVHQTLVGALAAYTESPVSRKTLELLLGMMIGRPLFNAVEGVDGGGAYIGLYETIFLKGLLRSTSVFPEAHLERNPFLRTSADWFSRIRPVGAETEMFLWGDASGSGVVDWNYFGYTLSGMTGLNWVAQHYNNQRAINPLNEFYSINQDGVFLFEKYAAKRYFSTFSTKSETRPLAQVFPAGGWVLACTYQSTDPRCFKQGLGFAFAARPTVNGGHAANAEGSYELWAYGQTITENGSMQWFHNKNAANHNLILVNGAGPYQYDKALAYARIFAFDDGNSASIPYVYAASDTSDSYQLLPTGKEVTVRKANRHFLMVKNKYFVVFDDLETAQPAKFTSVYHVLDDPLTKDQTKPATYSYVKTRTSARLATTPGRFSYYNPTPVKVYVADTAHTTDGSLEVLYRSGATDLSTNPISGQIIGEIDQRSSYCYLPNYLDSGNCSDARKNSVWISNKNDSNTYNFLKVIYPQKPGTNETPVIERLDDYTVSVTDSSGTDIISFNTDSASQYGANLVVDTATLVPRPVPDGGFGVRLTPRTGSYPVVAITSPISGTTRSDPASFTITATATDADGTVSKVDFYNGTTKIGTDTTSPYSYTWSAVTAGSYTLYARATDNSGNVGSSVGVSVTVTGTSLPTDTTPPTISNITVSNTTTSGTTISWTTNENSTTQIEYGLTTGYGSVTQFIATPSLNHSQTISGLQGNTVYHYRVASHDAAGNEVLSPDQTFTTLTSTDNDGDGVLNTVDRCPLTPPSLRSVVNTYGCPLPLLTSNKFPTVTDLANKDITALTTLELGNTYGKVTYGDTGTPYKLIRNTDDQIDIDSNLTITKGLVSLDSTQLPELNKRATITLYNLNITSPRILKDGNVCSGCTFISYTNGTLIFSVPSFSTYSVIDDSDPTPTTHTVSVTKMGSGTGTVTGTGISCGSDCSETVSSSITLTASPSSDSTFSGWSGGYCTGTSSCTITPSADATVIANFDAIPVAPVIQTRTTGGSGGGSSRTTTNTITTPVSNPYTPKTQKTVTTNPYVKSQTSPKTTVGTPSINIPDDNITPEDSEPFPTFVVPTMWEQITAYIQHVYQTSISLITTTWMRIWGGVVGLIGN